MSLTNDPQERPDECESCGYETDLKAYSMCRSLPKSEYKWLCNLCAGTMAGNAYEYPEQYENVPLFQTVCYVGNAILDAVKAQQVKP